MSCRRCGICWRRWKISRDATVSLFFLSNPTLIIVAGLSYCIGDHGFGTQLEPLQSTGQPNPAGPYPAFPPTGGGLSTFIITANGAGTTNEGYADGTLNGPWGTLDSGGGTGGNTLNGFFGEAVFGSLTVVLQVTGASSPPPQDLFNQLLFVDQSGNTATLLSDFIGSTYPGTTNNVLEDYSYENPGGSPNTSQWNWIFGAPTAQMFIGGDNYSVVVS